MSLNPHLAPFGECPQLDYLLVPGGEGTRQQVNNEALIRFVSNQAKGFARPFSRFAQGSLSASRRTALRPVCHHPLSALSRLTELGDVTVCPERVVRDGQVWTAAGISAGIDLALAFIESVAGETVAGKVQLGAEYYPSGRILRDVPPKPGRSGLFEKGTSPFAEHPGPRKKEGEHEELGKREGSNSAPCGGEPAVKAGD